MNTSLAGLSIFSLGNGPLSAPPGPHLRDPRPPSTTLVLIQTPRSAGQRSSLPGWWDEAMAPRAAGWRNWGRGREAPTRSVGWGYNSRELQVGDQLARRCREINKAWKTAGKKSLWVFVFDYAFVGARALEERQPQLQPHFNHNHNHKLNPKLKLLTCQHYDSRRQNPSSSPVALASSGAPRTPQAWVSAPWRLGPLFPLYDPAGRQYPYLQ